MTDLQHAIDVIIAFTGRPWKAANIADEAASPVVDQAIATILNAVVSGALAPSADLSWAREICDDPEKLDAFMKAHPLSDVPGGSMGCVGDVKPMEGC